MRSAYAESVLTGLREAPSLAALTSLVRSDGIETVAERTTAMRMAEEALDGHAREAEDVALVASATRTVAVGRRLSAESAQAEAAPPAASPPPPRARRPRRSRPRRRTPTRSSPGSPSSRASA